MYKSRLGAKIRYNTDRSNYKQNQKKKLINLKKETVTLTEIEMISKDIVADLIRDDNTKVEWIDGDEDRNGEHILHMAVAQWKLLDIIEAQLLKRVINKDDKKQKEIGGSECGSRE